MQTDSHMDFVPDWETKMLDMWALTNNEYAVLSTYVTDSSELKHQLDGEKGLNNLFEVPHLCMVTLEGANQLVRNWGTKSCRMLPKPKLTNMLWGAGLSFSKCHAERKVPYDPHTPYIFDGEEVSPATLWLTLLLCSHFESFSFRVPCGIGRGVMIFTHPIVCLLYMITKSHRSVIYLFIILHTI